MLHLSDKCVLLDLQAKTKDEVLEELALAAQNLCPHIKIDTLSKVLKERESVGSTGVGEGVAIPHGKIAEIDKTLLCFGRSHEGIYFDAVDNKPVRLFVMILSPMDVAEEYLHTLAMVSKLLKQPKNRETLLQAKKMKSVIKLFNKLPGC